jgi:type IV pilus assembly protein PilM
MAVPKEAWGIDVGQVALKAIKLRELGDDVEAVAYGYVEHPKILSQVDQDAEEFVRQAIQQFASQNEIGSAPIAIGVPGHHTLARFTKLPPVDAKKIPDIVKYEAEQQIPFDLDEVIWDYQVFGGEGSPDLEVGIFAMKRDLIGTQLNPFTSQGIEPTMVQASPLAMFNAMVYDGIAEVSEENASAGTVMLDIGAVNSDLIIGAGNGLWTRTIQIGGNSFTEALVKVFKLSFSKAENLKRTASTSKYARQVFQAMRPVFADLVAEVQRSLGFYGSTRRDVKIVRLIGLGNAFQMPGLQKFVQQNLGIEVVKPDSFNRLVPTSGSHPKEFQDNLLGYGVAYGLALQALGRARVNSNLLPTEISRQAMWRKKNPWFAATAACFLLAAGIIWARHFIDKGALAGNIGAYDGRIPTLSYNQARDRLARGGVPDKPAREYAADWLAIAKALNDEMAKKQDEENELRARLDRYSALQDHKTTLLGILDRIHRALPQPDTPLAKAANAREYAALVADQQFPRTERQALYVDEFECVYDHDVVGLAFDSVGQDEELGNEYEYPEEFAAPGFFIQMRLRSPNRDSKYAEKTFLANLKEFSKHSDRGFYFDFIQVHSRRQIRSTPNIDLVVSPPVPGSGYKFADSKEKSRSERLRDPLTGESMETDWRCTVSMMAVLGEPPAPPEEVGDRPEEEAPPERPD